MGDAQLGEVDEALHGVGAAAEVQVSAGAALGAAPDVEDADALAGEDAEVQDAVDADAVVPASVVPASVAPDVADEGAVVPASVALDVVGEGVVVPASVALDVVDADAVARGAAAPV